MLQTFGQFVLFIRGMMTRTERFSVLWRRTIDEAILIGVDSVFIVAIVSAFIGAVTCVQIAYNLTNPLIPTSTIGYMVREMTILELAPTITCIVLAGKVGSSIAGGLGTMRITEQVSALEVMGINSTSYLVLPRIIAALLMFPILVVLAMVLSILGGYLAGTLTGAMAGQEYIEGIRTDFIDYTVDLNPHKQGNFLPGTRIPVLEPRRILETQPDYLLILPWNLREEIMSEMAAIRDWGGQFVVPIPEVQVYA